MQKVGIVADSIACLPPEVVRQHKVRIVPLNICYDGRVYREGIDISATEAYKLLAETPEHWGTSPGSAGDYLAAYHEMTAEFREILCITLSSKLSTLHNMALVAKEQAEAELAGIRIEVLDSMNAAAGETLVALAAVRAAADGKDLGGVIEAASEVRDKVNVIGVFETIRHVYRTGRIPKVASTMLSALNVKPLFKISGGVHITSVDTNKERAVNRLLAAMKGRVEGRPIRVAVSHANVPDEGERLRQRIASEFNCIEMLFTDFSPIMGYATGEGTLIIAYYTEG